MGECERTNKAEAMESRAEAVTEAVMLRRISEVTTTVRSGMVRD